MQRIILTNTTMIERRKNACTYRFNHNNRKKVYVVLPDVQAQTDFLAKAQSEGFTFPDGVMPCDRHKSDCCALNKDKTICFVNSIGRMAMQAEADNILRVKYPSCLTNKKI